MIIGFDEYMNMVLDDALEIHKDQRTPVGRILLKGDAITLLQYVEFVFAFCIFPLSCDLTPWVLWENDREAQPKRAPIGD